jgi:hypothetical protein
MSKPRDERQKDLFRPCLEQIIDMNHPLVGLAGEIDWSYLGQRFGSVCTPGPGQPPLPSRLIAGLFILKHMHSLSDEALCARWVKNPLYQVSGGKLFLHSMAPLLNVTQAGTPMIAKRSLNLISGRELIARTKIPHSGSRSSKRTGPIYYGGRRPPSHGFSRSPSVLVMAKLTFALRTMP